MTDRLAEWKRITEAATAGPWTTGYADSVENPDIHWVEADPAGHPYGKTAIAADIWNSDDADFIAIAREAMPKL